MSETSNGQKQIEEIINDLDEAEYYLTANDKPKIDELQRLATNQNNEAAATYALYFHARIKIKTGDVHEAISLFENVLRYFEQNQFKKKQIDTLIWLGWCKGILIGKFNEAIAHLKKAIEVAEQAEYKIGLGKALNHLGANYHIMGYYSQALDCHMRSLKIREESGDIRRMATSYNNIGIIYSEQGNYPEALENHFRSLKINEEMNEKDGMASSFSNIGSIYHEQGKYQQALDYHHRAQNIYEESGNKQGMASAFISLSDTYLKLNEISQSEEYSAKGLALAEEIGSNSQIIDSRNSLASVLIKENKFNEAISYLLKTLDLTEKTNEKPRQKIVLGKLYECFKLSGNAINALKYYEKYIKIKDELFNEETSRKIAGLELASEMEQKEKDRKFAQKEAEIERLKNVELKKAYEDLKSAQKELIKKERMAAIGTIASEIAHEVQNPLNFVNNFSELNKEIVRELVDEINLNGLSDYARELIKDLNNNSASININGKRAAGIVSQLLELTRQNKVQTE